MSTKPKAIRIAVGDSGSNTRGPVKLRPSTKPRLRQPARKAKRSGGRAPTQGG
jgi:hypothetical protein